MAYIWLISLFRNFGLRSGRADDICLKSKSDESRKQLDSSAAIQTKLEISSSAAMHFDRFRSGRVFNMNIASLKVVHNWCI